MSFNEDEAEIDRILAQADNVGESPELLGAVRPSTNDTSAGIGNGTPEGGNGGVRMGGDSCHGSPPSLSHPEEALEAEEALGRKRLVRATENSVKFKSEVRRIVYRPIPL